MQTLRRMGSFVLLEGEEDSLRRSGCDDDCVRGLKQLARPSRIANFDRMATIRMLLATLCLIDLLDDISTWLKGV